MSFDWFKVKQYIFYVLASDKGTPSRSSSVKVIVDVSDVNEAPVFNPSVYNISVSEAIQTHTSLLKIIFHDYDSSPNNKVLLTLVDGNIESTFYVDNNILKLKKLLDYEQKKNYQLKVSANDSGTPSLVATKQATIYINVLNNNDNQPRFDINPYMIEIDEGRLSSGVLKVQANDKDRSNGISYSIVAGEDSKHFTINANSGEITSFGVLDYEVQKRFVFSVNATDNANPSLFYNSRRICYTERYQ